MGHVPSFQVLKLFRVVHFKEISMAFRCPVLAPDTANVNGFCIILVLVPAPVPETASVNTPLVGHQPRKVGTGGLELSPLRKKKTGIEKKLAERGAFREPNKFANGQTATKCTSKSG